MNSLKKYDRTIAFQRIFVDLVGSVTGALFLSQAVYWQLRCKADDGWWYKTQENWTEETGMSRHELGSARKACEKFLAHKLTGVPATSHYRVDAEAIEHAVELLESPSLPESGKLVTRNPANWLPGIRQTTNKTEMTTPKGAGAPASKKLFPEVPLLLQTPEFLEAWANWLEDRAIRKKPVTPLAAKIQLGQCLRWGVAKAVQSINTSISCNYQGLFEPRDQKPNGFAPQRPAVPPPNQPFRARNGNY